MNLPNSLDEIPNGGAKIWLVLAEDYVGGELIAWNEDHYLYEHDVVVYLDCDLEEPALGAVPYWMTDVKWVDLVEAPLLVPSREELPILTCYDFDLLIAAGEYSLTTTVSPVIQ